MNDSINTKKLNPDWFHKIFAERRRVDGKPTEYETVKAKSRMRGILEYKNAIQDYLLSNEDKLSNHINPTVSFARREMISEMIDILYNISPNKPVKIDNQFTRLTDEFADGNRVILIYQRCDWNNTPEPGWYDNYGVKKYTSIHTSDYHKNMDALMPVVKCVKADIIIAQREAEFDDNYVMQRNYQFLNVLDLWADTVLAIKGLKGAKLAPAFVEKPTSKLYLSYAELQERAKANR
jgi:hypothetical protein